ncbi:MULTISPECIES: iron-containing alcohol dehydrogenase [unclassified Mycobacterium]|uniref:iron-containing alcohol dehydrogenase n=1 Tax=unclassified Mycobacterium TaxID=2642494 RepID=UPI0029C7EB54|nr:MULTISPECIES: iron-containing alcohol dehydrogenase [unclassified Mycobacterium]
MSTRIALPRYARFGAGALNDVGELVKRLGSSRPAVITDAFLAGNGRAERVMELLRAVDTQPVLFSETVPDPTTDSLDAALQVIREHRADAVIGFGGGSPMDTAKALAVLASNGGQMRDYRAPRSYEGPVLPIIAIPTTAGSGSETTQFTIITDTAADEKMLCPGLSFLPVAAIVDFELTLSMPPRLTADTGIDALTHAVEAYVSRKANPISDALALAAIKTISANLRRAYHDGADRDAREAMMMAATQAGIAFSNSSVALVHGMSRPIGAHFHVAHGLSNAMLFPAVTAFSLHAAPRRYAECARAYGISAVGSDLAVARRFVDKIASLCEELHVPTPRAYGIDKTVWEDKIPIMAQQALDSGSPANNPAVPTNIEIQEIYADVYDDRLVAACRPHDQLTWPAW